MVIADVLTLMGSIMTWLLSQVTAVFALMVANPITLVPFILILGFTVVRFVKYFLGIR